MKASAAARLVLAFTLAALRCAFASSSLWKAPIWISQFAAGVSFRFGFFSYHKTRLACDFARLGASGFDVVSQSRLSRLHLG